MTQIYSIHLFCTVCTFFYTWLFGSCFKRFIYVQMWFYLIYFHMRLFKIVLLSLFDLVLCFLYLHVLLMFNSFSHVISFHITTHSSLICACSHNHAWKTFDFFLMVVTFPPNSFVLNQTDDLRDVKPDQATDFQHGHLLLFHYFHTSSLIYSHDAWAFPDLKKKSVGRTWSKLNQNSTYTLIAFWIAWYSVYFFASPKWVYLSISQALSGPCFSSVYVSLRPWDSTYVCTTDTLNQVDLI